METFAWQVLNEDSDIKGCAEVLTTVRTYVSVMDIIQARRKRLMWDAHAGLNATQSTLGHIVHFLSNNFKDPSLFEMERNVPMVKWSESSGAVVCAGGGGTSRCIVQSARLTLKKSLTNHS